MVALKRKYGIKKSIVHMYGTEGGTNTACTVPASYASRVEPTRAYANGGAAGIDMSSSDTYQNILGAILTPVIVAIATAPQFEPQTGGTVRRGPQN